MSVIALFLVGNLVSLSCVIAALVIALRRLPGWGWFLFIAVICQASVETDDLDPSKQHSSASVAKSTMDMKIQE